MPEAPPSLSPEQMAQVEQKLVTSGLAKVNSGLTPSKLEMEAIRRAGARGEDHTAPPAGLTELGFEVELADTLDKRGLHDGSRLLERKPEVFRIVVALLARNTPIRDVCQICGVSAHTVQSVADHPEAQLPAATQKEQFVAKLRLAASLGLEALIDRFRTGEVSGVEWGIVVDKLALAEGGVTSRSEVLHRDQEEDEWTRMVREARRQQSGIVIEAEEISPMAGALPALPLPSLPVTPSGVSKDSQSPDSGNQTIENQ